MVESVGKGYKPWIVASIAVLVGSLLLFIVTVFIGFVYYSETGQPLWVVLMGVASVLGIGLGFGGFFLLMMAAGWLSWREDRRVQVLPPEREAKDSQANIL